MTFFFDPFHDANIIYSVPLAKDQSPCGALLVFDFSKLGIRIDIRIIIVHDQRRQN